MSKRQLSPAWAYVHDILQQYPNTPSLTLAKKIVSENPALFTTVEAARTAIRYFRGASGSSNRKHADPKLLRPFDEALFNPFGLPDSDEVEYIPFILPDDCSRVLYLTDVHVPYHNIAALTAAIQYGIELKADSIFIGGDFLDFYSLSSFEKDPRRRSFKEELKTALELLEILRREFPKARIFYQLGNHEERFERFMRVKAPELLDMEEFRLENLLDFERLGIELIDQKRVAKLGRLNLVHGHEFGRGGASSPVNPARGLYMKAKTSTVCGHHHQTSEHTEPNLNGEIATTWSVGCLCELSPDYRPINKWNHGVIFIECDHDRGGWFNVENRRILNGSLI